MTTLLRATKAWVWARRVLGRCRFERARGRRRAERRSWGRKARREIGGVGKEVVVMGEVEEERFRRVL